MLLPMIKSCQTRNLLTIKFSKGRLGKYLVTGIGYYIDWQIYPLEMYRKYTVKVTVFGNAIHSTNKSSISGFSKEKLGASE